MTRELAELLRVDRPSPQRPRDVQRRRLYRWERQWWPAEPRPVLSLEACQALVADIWQTEMAGRPGWRRPPEVRDGRRRRSACANRYWIKLPRWSRFPHLIVHELAHSLFLESERHGPVFVGRVLHLLARYCGLDHDQLWHSAVNAGLKVKLYRR